MENEPLIIFLHGSFDFWKVVWDDDRLTLYTPRLRKVFTSSGLMHPSIDTDDVEFVMVLQDFNVLQGIAIDKDAIREVADLDLAHFVGSHKQLRHPKC